MGNDTAVLIESVPGTCRQREAGGVRLDGLSGRPAVRLVALITVGAVGVLLWAGCDAAAAVLRADRLDLTARLVASDKANQAGPAVLFGSPGISAGVAIGGAPWATVGANRQQGTVYVFTEPAGGWSTETETARLVASDGRASDQLGSTAAVSGDTIVAGRNGLGAMAVYVFTKPAGGWSGTVHESAQLTLTDPTVYDVFSLAMSGDTIVIGGSFNGRPGNPTGFVFTKPSGGWSGVIHESAKLTIPGATGPCFDEQGAVAIDGRTIAAACSGHAYVFTEPASGWTGTVQPSATLVSGGPATSGVTTVAVLGSSIAASVTGPYCAVAPVVFDEPASGWSGTILPAARLKVAATCNDAVDGLLAGSREEIAALEIPQNDESCQIFMTCTATLNAFSQSPAGWKGTIAGTSQPVPIATPAGESPPALDGRTILTGGQGELDLFTPMPEPAQPRAPSARNASLTSVVSGKPRLRFTLDHGHDAPSIRSIRLSLPPGLRFAQRRISLTRGVHATVANRAVSFTRGALTITLRRPAARAVAFSITSPALIAQQTLVARLRRIANYNRHHRRKRGLTLNVDCRVTDARGHTTRVNLKTRVA